MDIASWIFFGPGKLIAIWPYAGAPVAITLIGVQAWLSWRKRSLFARDFFREAPVLAGALWLIFNLYELQFAATFAKTHTGANLRMDLIILVPILYVLTAAAVLSIHAQLRKTEANK
jgi:uncharacterized membrane protein SirB2